MLLCGGGVVVAAVVVAGDGAAAVVAVVGPELHLISTYFMTKTPTSRQKRIP